MESEDIIIIIIISSSSSSSSSIKFKASVSLHCLVT